MITHMRNTELLVDHKRRDSGDVFQLIEGHEIAVGPILLQWHHGVLLVEHPNLQPDGTVSGRCTAAVHFGDNEEDHRVANYNALTIEPSVNCPNCAWHQWIRDGVIQ